MRIGVTGGRGYRQIDRVERALVRYPLDAVLVHGAAPGADRLAALLWTGWGGKDEPHPADWSGPCKRTCRPGHRKQRPDGSDYCPAAGVYRNQEMVHSGLNLLVAFPGGTGTADMIRRARAGGIRVEVVGDVRSSTHAEPR